MGIILFNNIPEDLSIVDLEYLGFRPLMGIILFNYLLKCRAWLMQFLLVSVP